MSWLAHLFFAVTGSRDESGAAYGFWSGFGGSIPDFLILGGLATLYRKHNCHVQGCPRIGRHQAGPYIVCRRHMPGGAPSAAQVAEAHRRRM